MKIHTAISRSLLVLFIMSGFTLTACGGDEPDMPDKPGNTEYPNNPTDNNNSGENDQGGDNTGNNQSQYLQILLKHWNWSWDKGLYDSGFFTFYNQNKIQFLTVGKSQIGSYGIPNLNARGTFSISGSTLTATFNDISVDPSLSSQEMSKHFPGWVAGSSKTVKYTIKSLTDENLTLTDGSKTWYLTPF